MLTTFLSPASLLDCLNSPVCNTSRDCSLHSLHGASLKKSLTTYRQRVLQSVNLSLVSTSKCACMCVCVCVCVRKQRNKRFVCFLPRRGSCCPKVCLCFVSGPLLLFSGIWSTHSRSSSLCPAFSPSSVFARRKSCSSSRRVNERTEEREVSLLFVSASRAQLLSLRSLMSTSCSKILAFRISSFVPQCSSPAPLSLPLSSVSFAHSFFRWHSHDAGKGFAAATVVSFL